MRLLMLLAGDALSVIVIFSGADISHHLMTFLLLLLLTQ